MKFITQMQVAFEVAGTQMGTKEIGGRKDNPKIVEYHQACTLQATDDETPWCSSFVNWAWIIAGILLNPAGMVALLRKARYEEVDIRMFIARAIEIAPAVGFGSEALTNMRGTGYVVRLPTRSALARSWATGFVRTKTPKRGGIVVYARGNNGVSGHVGFIHDVGLVYITTRGGNQGNRVCDADYARARVLAYLDPDAA